MEALLHPFSEPFVQTGLVTSLLLGGLCAYLGIFLVLKRIVFVGAALSQMAAAGVALGHLLGHRIHFESSPQWFGFFFALAGAAIFWVPFSGKRLSRESWIGYVYALAAAAAILIVAKDPQAEAENLDLLSGNILFATGQDLLYLGLVVLLVALLHFLFHKEFLFVSFDPDTARTLRLPARLYEFLLYFTLGITVAVGIKMAGVLYIFSSLVIPAVFGLHLFSRLPWAVAAAIFSIALSSVAGVLVSYYWDLPTAPAISVVNALMVLPAMLLRRR